MKFKETTKYLKILSNQKGLIDSIEVIIKYVNDKFSGVEIQHYPDKMTIEKLNELEELIEILNQARCVIKCSK